ncbi:hypothetical protein GCM10007112_06740 [Vulcanisaeta souniana JCM 11219]|nr:hypothetical protein GCM10007112_06740 [Vulcanisaeta souniana JCM 11219]
MVLKMMVARELHRLGYVNTRDFPSLLTKISQYMDNSSNSIEPSDMIYLLDIIMVNGDKMTLSDEGIHYLRMLEILTNDASKFQ